MEDMTVKANTVIKGECTNVEMERVIRWDRMKFKPSKLTSLVMWKGLFVKHQTYEFSGKTIEINQFNVDICFVYIWGMGWG